MVDRGRDGRTRADARCRVDVARCWYLGQFEAAEADAFLDVVALAPLRVERGERQQAHDVLERSREWQMRPEVSEANLYITVPCLETAILSQETEYARSLSHQLLACAESDR